MGKKVDRRVVKTRRQLRTGLARLMKEKSVSQITVKELVEEVGINRSTFYLHFKDIKGLLDEIEDSMEAQIKRAIREHPIEEHRENVFYFIEDIFRVLSEEREIGCALLGPNGDIGFIGRIETIIEENSRATLENLFPGSKEDLKYFYAFCLSGCLGLVKTWLREGQEKPPEEIAQMTFRMVANVKEAFGLSTVDLLDKGSDHTLI